MSITAIYSLIDPITETFGLAGSDAKRFVVVAGLTGLTTWVAKPESMFTSNGQGRPWKLIDPNDKNATYLTWYAFSGIMGGVAALFL
jgi:hypothetical protein